MKLGANESQTGRMKTGRGKDQTDNLCIQQVLKTKETLGLYMS